MPGNNLVNKHGGNFCLVTCGLAEGTNSATLKTQTAIDYCIDGIIYEKGVTDNIAMTACDAQAINTNCLYLVSIDSSGTVTVTKGDEVTSTEWDSGERFLEWPKCPADDAPIGGFNVDCSSAAFTSGTTDLTAAGSVTYYDFFSVPSAAVAA